MPPLAGALGRVVRSKRSVLAGATVGIDEHIDQRCGRQSLRSLVVVPSGQCTGTCTGTGVSDTAGLPDRDGIHDEQCNRRGRSRLVQAARDSTGASVAPCRMVLTLSLQSRRAFRDCTAHTEAVMIGAWIAVGLAAWGLYLLFGRGRPHLHVARRSIVRLDLDAVRQKAAERHGWDAQRPRPSRPSTAIFSCSSRRTQRRSFRHGPTRWTCSGTSTSWIQRATQPTADGSSDDSSSTTRTSAAIPTDTRRRSSRPWRFAQSSSGRAKNGCNARTAPTRSPMTGSTWPRGDAGA